MQTRTQIRELRDWIETLEPDEEGEVKVDARLSAGMALAYQLGMSKFGFVNKREALGYLAGLVDDVTTADVEVSEKGEWVMKDKLMGQAQATCSAMKDAGVEGLKQSGAKKVGRKIVAVVRSRTGEHHPKILNTDAGRKVEPMLFAAAAHYLAGAFEDRIPHAKMLQRNCERVVTAEMAEVGDDVLGLLEPLLEELSGIGGNDEEA